MWVLPGMVCFSRSNLARVVSLATLSKVNVSPGVLLFAQKGA
jgi:hypothetical protein